MGFNDIDNETDDMLDEMPVQEDISNASSIPRVETHIPKSNANKTTLTEKAASTVGNTVQTAGKTTQAVGAGMEATGKGLKATGKMMGSAGSAMTKAGNALNSTGIGAVLGVPLTALGTATNATGRAAQTAGTSMESAGQATKQAGKNIGKNGYNPFNNLKKNNHNRPNDNVNRRNNQENNSDNNKDSKNTNNAQNAKQKALEESIRKYAQAHGIPKPIADKAAKLGSKKILVEYEKKKKIIIVSVIVALFIIFIPILCLMGGNDMDFIESESRSSYLYQNGSDDDLYEYLIDIGVCDTQDECSTSQAATFYKELKKVMNSNYNLTEKHADSFIIKMIFYDREDDDAYEQTAEISYISNIISSNGSFNLNNASNYKEEFIKEGGYFDTYRTDLLTEDNSLEYKTEIYDEIVSQAENLVNKLEENAVEILTGETCRYNINGKSISNIKVRLLTCENHTTATPIDGKLIDFEKYILGVVYAENENGSLESYKAQAIATRNNSLLRGDTVGGNVGLTQENGQWILSIRNCTEDQVYCDPDNGCWSDDSTLSGTVYNGYDSSKAYTKNALAQNSIIRTAVADTSSKILVDKSGVLFNTPYEHEDKQEWNAFALEGKDHFEILKLEYTSAEKIISTCNSAVVGDFISWKQCRESWSSTSLGSSSLDICDAGCLVTSVSIQIAKSGTTIQNVTGFDPGIFVSYLNDHNGFTGPNFYWNSPKNSGIAPNFIYAEDIDLNGTQSERTASIKSYADQGYYIVIRAKTNQHWVALDYVSGGVVYIHDPASSATKLWDKYPIETKKGQTLPTRIVLYRNDG